MNCFGALLLLRILTYVGYVHSTLGLWPNGPRKINVFLPPPRRPPPFPLMIQFRFSVILIKSSKAPLDIILMMMNR